MLILGIDTSSPATSIALLEDDRVLALFHEDHDHPPSDAAFAILEGLLRGQGLALRDLDLFAACEGPGSFTGLRIGLGMVKTFAHALGRQVVSVDSVSAAAFGIGRQIDPGDRFGVVVPGFKRTCFVGLFRRDTEGPSIEAELDYVDGVEELESFRLRAARPLYATRPLAIAAEGVDLVTGVEATALSIARIARARQARGDLTAFDGIQPRYLKPFNVGAKARRPEDLR